MRIILIAAVVCAASLAPFKAANAVSPQQCEARFDACFHACAKPLLDNRAKGQNALPDVPFVATFEHPNGESINRRSQPCLGYL